MNGHGSTPIAKHHRPNVSTRLRFGGIELSHTSSMRAGRILIAVTPEQTTGFGIRTVGYSVALFGAIAILGWTSKSSILGRLLLMASDGGRAFLASLLTVWLT